MAEQKVTIDQVKQRTYRYFYEDGLVELGIGLLFVIIALFVRIMKEPPEAPWHIVAGVGLPLLVIGGAVAARRLIAVLKERVTYPRTGYVSYREKPGNGRWFIVFAALALSMIALLLPYEWADAMSLMVGLLLAIIHIYMAGRVHLNRLYGVAIVAALSGLGAAVFGLGDIDGVTVVFGLSGVAVMITGGAALAIYLRNNPLHNEGQTA